LNVPGSAFETSTATDFFSAITSVTATEVTLAPTSLR
jgi:hypothetical protein